MIKYKKISENKVSVFKNVLINDGKVTAYYILNPYNYTLMDTEATGRHISRLHNVLSTLYGSMSDVKISMFQLKNIVSRKETIESIVKTVRIYKEDYSGFPKEYQGYIKNITREFSIIAVQIDAKNSLDIESQSLREIIKGQIDRLVQENFSTSVSTVDETVINAQNTRITNTLARMAVPANEKLVMNIYINSLFPSYNLVYKDHMISNRDTILSGVKQDIIPGLGFFEMSNSGIADFGATPRSTFGSIIRILEFPDTIMSESFNISVPGLRVNMHLLQKDKALLKFKRIRADITEEAKEAENVSNIDSSANEELSLAQRALDDIKNGRIVTDVDANILVTADTRAELDKRKKIVISRLSDAGIVASIAGNQGKSFIDSFVKLRPTSYDHTMDLQYALSFQLDSGVLVGDQESAFSAPVIGVSS